ncbi:MAG: tRNA adenosine(34) deaminase TadA [Clostridia bacterium]|nr:tRNA adenosine(34) deaminase TadA [Clostridia bacterium]
MTEKDIVFMKEALRLAEAARDAGEIPVGAVVVKNGEVIGRGQNCRESGGGASAHAEILAINEACAKLGGWRLTGCELYVTLEPCPMCAGAIVNARLDRVVFGASDKKMGALGGLFSLLDYPLGCKTIVESGVLEDECKTILDSFFTAKREVNQAEKNKSKRLGRDFYTADVLDVAPALLGKLLCRRVESGEVVKYRITETEAYRGEDDTACHASKGKTSRTSVMWDKGGTVYVYLCYGMHNMLNIVTGVKGDPQAVLIRGIETADGPGKLTKKLAIERRHNGADVVFSDELWIEDDSFVPENINTSPRIGIDYADEKDRLKPWRFTYNE